MTELTFEETLNKLETAGLDRLEIDQPAVMVSGLMGLPSGNGILEAQPMGPDVSMGLNNEYKGPELT